MKDNRDENISIARNCGKSPFFKAFFLPVCQPVNHLLLLFFYLKSKLMARTFLSSTHTTLLRCLAIKGWRSIS